MTASLAKSRISDRMSSQKWRGSPSPADLVCRRVRNVSSSEDWSAVRLAADPRVWQVHRRFVVPTHPWLPPAALDQLAAIGRVAADASWMVELGEWDSVDGGSYDLTTIERVRDFLESIALISWETFGYQLDVPHPAPADEGSIDVFFEDADRNLLINIPQGEELVTYFGSDRSGTTIGGSLSRRHGRRDLMTIAAWIQGIQ